MKKIIFGLCLLASLIFTSCFNPVYYYIQKDVPPLTPTVMGTIRSITRYTVDGKEFLALVSEQGLLYKDASNKEYKGWKTYSALPPFEKHHYDYYGTEGHVGEQMLVTHADSDTLYLVTAEYKNDDEVGTAIPGKMRIYAKKITLAEDGVTWSTDGDWTSILDDDSGRNYTPFYRYNTYYLSAFALFSTNSVQPEHRKVYLRAGDASAEDDSCKAVTYYEISGLNSPVEISVTPEDIAHTDINNANSAVYFDGGIKFFNAVASTTNETAQKDATAVYYGFKKDLYYKTISDAAYTKSEFSMGQQAIVLCASADSLIIGRGNWKSADNTATGGVVRTSLDENGVIGTDLTSFTSNIETQLQNSYFVLSLINTDPSLPEDESALYASIDFIGNGAASTSRFTDVGLWSYYPERGNWNRE